MHVLKHDVYLTADKSKAVPADDPDAAFLLGRAGDEVSDADAERYGVRTKSVKQAEVEDKAEDGPRARGK